ncbi:DUF3147 family protein [Tissierella sp.]|uniref:DUF3147 family protein n=1 Tax=Tissierella sp. TaxID=41274 RepID=UPI00285F169F|nr:DUF3147 family protein [Tissierella sp.]MDR7855119.1 DUF3147 family protein [Tissierella sp.]
MQFLIKTIVSALIIASISTVSKKLPTFGAIIASLPLTSILAMIWLYEDTKDVNKVIELSTAIFWIVIPSLIFFIAVPILLKKNIGFYPSLLFSSIIMIVSYYLYIMVLRLFKVNI